MTITNQGDLINPGEHMRVLIRHKYGQVLAGQISLADAVIVSALEAFKGELCDADTICFTFDLKEPGLGIFIRVTLNMSGMEFSDSRWVRAKGWLKRVLGNKKRVDVQLKSVSSVESPLQ